MNDLAEANDKEKEGAPGFNGTDKEPNNIVIPRALFRAVAYVLGAECRNLTSLLD